MPAPAPVKLSIAATNGKPRGGDRPWRKPASAVAAERTAIDRLAALGIDMESVADALVDEGIVKFVKPFDALLAALDEKRNLLAAN